jgi:hypothetical protein
VLVWVDPIPQGKTEALDPLLRKVAARGPWVSAHPDVILKMGVKEDWQFITKDARIKLRKLYPTMEG